MTNATSFIERRQHPRFTIHNGTVALLIGDQVKMGEILDISMSGLAFNYFGRPDDDLTGTTSYANFLIHDNGIYIEEIPCRVVADYVMQEAPSPEDNVLRRCDLQFQGLNPAQTAKIKRQIEINANQEAGKRHLLEKKLEKSEEKYRAILENIEEGYFEVDLSGNITFFNSAMLKIVGYGEEEAIGVNYRQCTDPVTAEKVFREYNRAYRTGVLPSPFDWEFVKKTGEKIYVETSLSFIKDADDKVIGFRGIARDVSQRKTFEQKLLYMASHDQLTGLYNRTAFFERLGEAIAYAKRFDKKCALFFLDLDNFKSVNDRYGHEGGDQVLLKAAARLTATLRETDYISRHGGDEFTIILNNPETRDLAIVAQKVIDTIAEPYYIGNQNIDFLTTSIGISIYPNDGPDTNTMVKNADEAMYRAKQEKNRYIFYNQAQFTETLPV